MARFSALIVEDDEGLRDSLGLLVTREGYDVRFASDRAQAQRMLREAPADVVLLDIGLPDGDGIELLRDEELAARFDFIVMTGNASVETAVQALARGHARLPDEASRPRAPAHAARERGADAPVPRRGARPARGAAPARALRPARRPLGRR
jgi:DNA-binding NtrC family response regulator